MHDFGWDFDDFSVQEPCCEGSLFHSSNCPLVRDGGSR
jgi:hypothetical protein